MREIENLTDRLDSDEEDFDLSLLRAPNVVVFVVAVITIVIYLL